MAHTTRSFYIKCEEKDILVSTKASPTGNCFIVYLQEGEVKLKSEGMNKKLWIEKGKGATSLAYKLGKLIEGYRNSESL